MYFFSKCMCYGHMIKLQQFQKGIIWRIIFSLLNSLQLSSYHQLRSIINSFLYSILEKIYIPAFIFIYTDRMILCTLLCMLLFCFVLVFCFWPHRAAWGILVPRPGMEPVPRAVAVRSPNHWTTREFPEGFFFFLTTFPFFFFFFKVGRMFLFFLKYF